jgi:hypothetical protein
MTMDEQNKFNSIVSTININKLRLPNEAELIGFGYFDPNQLKKKINNIRHLLIYNFFYF